MWKTILDLFFPINCLGCNQEGQFICPACFKQIPLNRKLPLKFSRSSALTGLIIASHYNHPLVKQALHRYKYDFVKDLAEPLGKLMVNRLNVILSEVLRLRLRINSESRRISKNFLLIPVPLHKKRLRWRGFNQAELLALGISRHLNISMANNILIRPKHNLPQVNIKSSPERKENIKQAFALKPGPALPGQVLKNKTIILVDDVCTTGATLEECALALRPLKPKQIWGLVVARG
jgi:ComF family protein